jgi:hypothetical protein
MIAWLQLCTFGHISHYENIVLTNIASVYIVFPCHAGEYAYLFFSDHLLLRMSWKSSVTSMIFCIILWWMYWCPAPVVCRSLYYFQYAFPNAILLCLVEGWWWTFKMHEFEGDVTIIIMALTIVITFFPSQHQSITFNCSNIAALSRFWILSEDTSIKDYIKTRNSHCVVIDSM